MGAIVWNVIEAVVAIASGVVAGSLALVGFGIDSSIEVFAAVVVLWRAAGMRRGARANGAQAHRRVVLRARCICCD